MRALRKVLVVDDDPVVGRSFDRVLSEKGYLVKTARDGPEALDKLGGEEFDVVFTDIKMPGMDGVELAGRVKARRPWVPVVIVTGYGTAANEARAKEAGVSAFLRKPLSPEVIEGSASRALLETDGAAVLDEVSEPAERAEAAAEAPLEAAADDTRTEARPASIAKSIALLVAAPFVGLAYVIAAPFAGLALLAWMGAKALMRPSVAKRIGGFLKNVALFIAAPFIGLAYFIAFPFVGMVMLAWMGARAWANRHDTK